MPRWGMVIDLAKCTGCQACVVACKTENNVPFSSPQQASEGRTISWIEVYTEFRGTYPTLQARLLPRPCFHCDNPPCTKVCPVWATYKNPEGLVTQIYPRCIGCRYCTTACPYTVKYFNFGPPQFPNEMKGCLDPDVSVRQKGVVEKCTFCHHRLQKAREKAKTQERAVTSADYQPACVQACPTGTMVFGDLDDPQADVVKLAANPRAFRLMEELGTEPKVFYLPE